MLLVPKRDFSCRTVTGVPLCSAKRPEIEAIFSDLRALVTRGNAIMARVRRLPPPFVIPPTFGPTLVAATQAVLVTLNRAVPIPDAIKPVLSLQASDNDLVERTAERARLIVDYIKHVATLFPQAIAALPPPPSRPLSLAQLTLNKLLTAGTGLAVVGGLGYLGWRSHLRSTGREDSAHLLPAEEGGDDDYEENDE